MIHVDLSKRNSIFSLILVWIFLTSTAPFVFFRWPGARYGQEFLSVIEDMVSSR